MENRLRSLQELYDGGSDAEPREDPEGASELASLREMKALLDGRPKRSPDPAVVSAVLAAARGESVPQRIRATDDRAPEAGEAAPLGRRGDRRPVARERSTVLRIGAASALVVLLLAVVGILHLEILDPPPAAPERAISSETAPRTEGGAEPDVAAPADNEPAPEFAEAPQAGDETASPEASASREREAAEESDVQVRAGIAKAAPASSESPSPNLGADRLAEGVTITAERPRMDRAATSAFAPAARNELSAQRSAEMASWDERADVLEVYQHIEMIGGGVEQGWEPPSMPLEMLPEQDPEYQQFLQQAGERRKPDQ